jgi:hypothetical protein
MALALYAMSTLGVVASAGAHEFISSKTGTLKGSGGKQVFTMGTTKAICETIALAGSVTTTKSETELANVQFNECEVFGGKASVTEAEVELNAEEGVYDVGGPIVITDATGKCSVKVESAGTGTAKYTTGKSLKVSATAHEIVYEPSGGICGEAKTLKTNGSYEGEASLELVGGTLEWK